MRLLYGKPEIRPSGFKKIPGFAFHIDQVANIADARGNHFISVKGFDMRRGIHIRIGAFGAGIW